METQQEGKAEKGFKNFGKKVDDFMRLRFTIAVVTEEDDEG